MKRILILFAVGMAVGSASVALLSRRATPQRSIDLSHAAVVTRMQALGNMETSSFTVEKIIEADKASGAGAIKNFLFGDKLLLVAHGDVIAGFNLAALNGDQVEVSGQRVTVTLPPPQILHVALDNEMTRVYDRSTGLLTCSDKDLESDARLAAEQSIRAAACEAGILTQAGDNAKKQLETLFAALDFTAVTVNVPGNVTCQ